MPHGARNRGPCSGASFLRGGCISPYWVRDRGHAQVPHFCGGGFPAAPTPLNHRFRGPVSSIRVALVISLLRVLATTISGLHVTSRSALAATVLPCELLTHWASHLPRNHPPCFHSLPPLW